MSTRTIIALLILIGAFAAIEYDKTEAPVKITACTQEAKQCPDGSYVSRSGPDCQFAACPTTSTPPKVELGTVKGLIGLVPACGGPIGIGPEPSCDFKGYETIINFTDSNGVTYKVNSNTKGQYSIKLKKGTYNMEVKGGSPLPSCPSETVIVSINQTTNKNVDCESGLR